MACYDLAATLLFIQLVRQRIVMCQDETYSRIIPILLLVAFYLVCHASDKSRMLRPCQQETTSSNKRNMSSYILEVLFLLAEIVIFTEILRIASPQNGFPLILMVIGVYIEACMTFEELALKIIGRDK